ncbi:MAG: hypothetical protein ABW061_13985, partial [Polyangiaceae bacterium]
HPTLAMPAPDADVVNRAQAMKLTPRIKRALIMLPAASLLLAFGALASGETADALLRRYPYDPACPWGRIGNGKGLIVRCLSEAEAQGLRSGTLPAVVASVTAPVSSAPPAVTAASSATPPVAAATPAEVAEADAGAPAPSDEKLDVTVGPVTADSGTLGIGKLGAARDRYTKCVSDNGGLKEKEGEVQVRFLLRQRGRAEGVSVAKRVGVSAEAARCVSDVVDRRYVGVPEAPIVGATVVIKFAKANK